MTAAGAAALTTTHRMVDRVHGNTADMRTFAHIAFLTGFTKLDIHVFFVADNTDGSFAFHIDHTDFTGGKLDLCINFFLTTENCTLTGRTNQLGSLTRQHFDIVDGHANRNIFDLQAVSRLQFSLRTVHHGLANLQTIRGKDVCLFCLKEMNANEDRDDEETETPVDEASLSGIDPVSAMDEIIPDIPEDIPAREYDEIESEMSLEELEDEEAEDED